MCFSDIDRILCALALREAASTVPSSLLALDCLPELVGMIAAAERNGSGTIRDGSAPVSQMLSKRSASLSASVNARWGYGFPTGTASVRGISFLENYTSSLRGDPTQIHITCVASSRCLHSIDIVLFILILVSEIIVSL